MKQHPSALTQKGYVFSLSPHGCTSHDVPCSKNKQLNQHFRSPSSSLFGSFSAGSKIGLLNKRSDCGGFGHRVTSTPSANHIHRQSWQSHKSSSPSMEDHEIANDALNLLKGVKPKACPTVFFVHGLDTSEYPALLQHPEGFKPMLCLVVNQLLSRSDSTLPQMKRNAFSAIRWTFDFPLLEVVVNELYKEVLREGLCLLGTQPTTAKIFQRPSTLVRFRMSNS